MRSLVLRFSRSYLSGLFLSRCHSCCRLARFHSRDSTESNKQGLSQHSDHLCPRILWTQTATKPKLGDASFIACFTQIHSTLYVKTRFLSLSHRPDPTRPSPLVHDPISRICFFSLSLMRVSFSGISPLESASQYFLRYAGQWRLSAEHTVTRWFQLSIPRSNNVNGELHMFSGQCFV